MGAIRIDKFGGMLPAWGDRLIPDDQATLSINAYLFSGELRGWRKPRLLRALTNSAAKYAYRIPKTVMTADGNPVFDSAIDSDSLWLEYTDPDTTVLRTPVVDDQYQRYYVASPSEQPKYNSYARIDAGDPFFLLGVPSPGCAPIISIEGGGNSATLGFSEVDLSGETVAVTANTVYLVPIQPTGAMELDEVSFEPLTDSTGHFAAVLYSDDNGAPSTLLNVGSVITTIDGNNTNTSPFVNPTGLLADTVYWIGVMFDVDLDIYKGTQNNTCVLFSNTFSNGPPATAPAVTDAQPDLMIWGTLATQDELEARAYVYTWVTAYDEEGPPSPPSLVNGWSNGVWTIQTYTPTADEMGVTRNITLTRIYRTISGVGGQTVYFFVAEIPVTTTSYTDAASNEVVAVNDQLISTNWQPPPEGLQQIVSMPNGVIAGFKNNEVWFCEPFRPHAWPSQYVLTTEFPIVGLGVSGNMLLAATTGSPYVMQGVSPSTMAPIKSPTHEPCISSGSILGVGDGLYYMSRNGLMKVDSTGFVQNSTELWITRERWAELVPLKNTRAMFLASCYFCFGTTNGSDVSVAQDGFTIELNGGDYQNFSILPQPGGHRLGFGQLTAPNDFDIDNVLVDPWTGIGMLIQNANVYYYDFSDDEPELMPYKWRSKIFQANNKKNFEGMKLYFTVPPNIPAQAADRNESDTDDASWDTLAADQYGIVRVYADGSIVTTREIRTSGELLRILSGYKYEQWQWEFEGRVTLSNAQVATNVKDLSRV